MSVQALQPLEFPLRGSHLIEASAGTGKTWTIAALYLRLVLGHGGLAAAPVPLMPDQILVMTFTRAATQELKDRIRQRLILAAGAMRQVEPPQEEYLRGLWSAYPTPAERNHAAHQLSLAAQAMDEAAIYTIDAWCQRMLREHALSSQVLFEERLLPDESVLVRTAIEDYWRQHVYPLNDAQAQRVLAVWKSVQVLRADIDKSVQRAGATQVPEPLGDCLNVWGEQDRRALQQLKAPWVEGARELGCWLTQQLQEDAGGWNTRKMQLGRVQSWLQALQDWAQGPDTAQDLQSAMKTGYERFTPQGLQQCRVPGAPEVLWSPWCQRYAQLTQDLAALPTIAQRMSRHAAQAVAHRVRHMKTQTRSLGFGDMPERLAQALSHPESGGALAQRLRRQFPVVVVDEFQDTSPLQLELLDRIYGIAHQGHDRCVLLIGDPKQSIYGFRGADIHSYLKARAATEGHHHALLTNHRASEDLVAVVNHLFVLGQNLSEGAFGYRQGHQDPVPFVPVRAKGREDLFCFGTQRAPALTWVHDGTLRTQGQALDWGAACCAERIVAWLSDPPYRFINARGVERPVRPRDIAVLVRNAQEAGAVRAALLQRGVRSVYLSDRDSVWASQEAADLLLWLQGVAQPQDLRHLMSAMGAGSWGWSLTELDQLLHDDQRLEAQVQTLLDLRRIWVQQGVLPMLRQTLHRLGLSERWRALPDGERRLTNFLHLAELLQKASQSLDGPAALVRWLSQSLAEGAPLDQPEEHILRLESDEDLVQVITVHKSKGLEFALVCIPFAHSVRPVTAKHLTQVLNNLPDPMVMPATPEQADALAQAEDERLREDIRLWYVALTRACHALWVAWSPVRKGQQAQCINHRSAAGHLLSAGQVLTAAQWPLALQTALAPLGDRVCLISPAEPVLCTLLPPPSPPAWTPLPALPAPRTATKPWTIASFSRMVRDLQTPVTLQPHSPADDEADAPTLGHITHAPWHEFPRGVTAGNLLHDTLQSLAAQRFGGLDQSRMQALIERACARQGWQSYSTGLMQWLQALVELPLQGPETSLQGLDSHMAEMEFWLPNERLDLAQVDALCQQHIWPGAPRPALPQSVWQGMLMGFSDLVIGHQGRFWVLDHKSNHLGPSDGHYRAEDLQASMLSHRYDVQASLYLLALHRLLRARLGTQYRPQAQLGGAIYLYLRGLQGPARGQCLLAPPWPLLEALDQMLGGAA